MEPAPTPSRAFLHAQERQDAGDEEAALALFLRHADTSARDDEAYVSLLRAGRLMERAEEPFDAVIAIYERASSLCPTRAEALCAASHLCFRAGRNQRGYELAKAGLGIEPARDALCAEPWVYAYGLLDALASNAYWIGAYRACAETCVTLLAGDGLPPTERERIRMNARHALEKLRDAPNLGRAGTDEFLAQHPLSRDRTLHSRQGGGQPTVLLAILAKQKERALPLYLACLEALDYPKSAIYLYIRTNNNTDRTEAILRDWVERLGHLYAGVEFDAADVPQPVQQFAVHEWNAMRFSVLGQIRDASLRRATALRCDYYFVADIDNYLRPSTLRELVSLALPIVAPFLRSVHRSARYSNYHAEIDVNGYFVESDQYDWILHRFVRGIIEVPVVHCTYLVRADVIPLLRYSDGSGRFEYVIFSDFARMNGIPQYLDNRQIYGYIAFDERETDEFTAARDLIASEIERGPSSREMKAAVFG